MKNFSDFRKLVRDKAHQWTSGNGQEAAKDSAIRVGSSGQEEGSPENALLKAFEEACSIIEQENLLLQNDAPMEAMGLLPRKTAAIENLHTLIENVQNWENKPEILPESLKEVQNRFNDVIKRNSDLLENSLHTQSVVMKILADVAAKDAQQSYNQTGTMVMDKSKMLGSFNNKI